MVDLVAWDYYAKAVAEPPHSKLGGVDYAAEANGGGACVFVAEFVGPLRNISNQIEEAEGAGALRVCVDVGERGAGVAAVRGGNVRGVPIVAPRVEARIGGLRGVLPFPFVREALAGPGSVGASIFERDPGDGFRVPAGGEISFRPVAQEIVIVGGVIVRGVEELFELRVGDGCAVDVVAVEMEAVKMRAARRIFPGILDVNAGIVAAFDFDAADGEVEVGLGNLQHALRRGGGGFGGRNFDNGLRNRRPGAGIFAQGFFGTLGHEGEEFAERREA